MSSPRMFKDKKYEVTIESKDSTSKAPQFSVAITHTILDDAIDKIIKKIASQKKCGVEFITREEDFNKITISIKPGEDFETADLQFRNLIAALPHLAIKDAEGILAEYKKHIAIYQKDLGFEIHKHKTHYAENFRWGGGAY